MPFRIERDDRERRIVVTLTGMVTLDLLLEYVQQVLNMGVWDWPTVLDMSAALAVDMAPGDVEEYALALSSLPPRGPVAVVAQTGAIREVDDWFRASARSHQVRSPRRSVVNTLAEAHAWLDTVTQS